MFFHLSSQHERTTDIQGVILFVTLQVQVACASAITRANKIMSVNKSVCVCVCALCFSQM